MRWPYSIEELCGKFSKMLGTTTSCQLPYKSVPKRIGTVLKPSADMYYYFLSMLSVFCLKLNFVENCSSYIIISIKHLIFAQSLMAHPAGILKKQKNSVTL